ncbi:MAG: serine/threonine-protein kinase [Paucibacter sp.]|nr:serine/threonine-protein kinase [Roseateles sp.]
MNPAAPPGDEDTTRLSLDAWATLAPEALPQATEAQTTRPATQGRVGDALSPPPPSPEIGDVLGAWRLVGQLGRGGMGQVFLAERNDGHYQQRAAIKLLLGLSGNQASLDQLARERQILASLNHPHIARLLDGGSTPAGLPYLVMEYVEGEAIDRYVARQKLSLPAILALFSMVCEALAYAHGQLVLHCDVKPGNVLVGADGRAMLLDFGVAQLQGRSAAGERQPGATDGPRSLGATPRFASPELLAWQPVSAASDVYSLGRLLQELLQLHQPQGPGPSPLRRAELAAIIAKATQQRPEQRYRSVPELQADLRRFQRQLPIEALPRRGPYVLRKLLRRRWLALSVSAGVLLLGLGFSWSLVHQRDLAEAARQQAQQEAENAKRVRQVVIAIFEDFDPFLIGRQPKSFAEFIDDAAARVDADLKQQPAVQAEMKHVLGLVYQRSGRSLRAIELLEQDLALQRGLPQRDLNKEALALHELTVALVNAGLAPRALPLAREALSLREAAYQARPGQATGSLLGDSLAALGLVLTRLSAFEEAGRHYQRALDIRRQHDGAESAKVASSLHSLGALAEREERYAQAQAWFEQSLALKAQRLPPDHPYTLNSRHGLAQALLGQQRLDDALPLLRELLAQRRRIHGERSVFALETQSLLARALLRAGQGREALALHAQGLSELQALLGASAMPVAQELLWLAEAQEAQGEARAALRSRREALAIQLAQAPSDPVQQAWARLQLGRALLRAGEAQEARPLIVAAAAELQKRRWPAGHSLETQVSAALAELGR